MGIKNQKKEFIHARKKNLSKLRKIHQNQENLTKDSGNYQKQIPLPYGKQKTRRTAKIEYNKIPWEHYHTVPRKIKIQAYGSGDGGGSNVVQGAHQPALPDRCGDLLEGGGRCGGDRQPRFLPGRLHGAPDLWEVLAGPIVHYTHHEGDRKNILVCKNQNYLKNKVKLKNYKDEDKRQNVTRQNRGRIKLYAARIVRK